MLELKGINPIRSEHLINEDILNLEQLKTNIDEINESINNANEKAVAYEKQLAESIKSKKDLDYQNLLIKSKESKLEYLSKIHQNIRTDLNNKMGEIDADEERINSLNKFEVEFNRWNIIVRKNDLTKELTESIVNPANEYLQHEGGAARAIADIGGEVSLFKKL